MNQGEHLVHYGPGPLVYEINPNGERAFMGERIYLLSDPHLRWIDTNLGPDADPFPDGEPVAWDWTSKVPAEPER